MRRNIVLIIAMVCAGVVAIAATVLSNNKKNMLDKGAKDYISESSYTEQTTEDYEQPETETEFVVLTEESKQEETLTFRVEVPETAPIEPVQLESGYTYDEYSEEEAIVAKCVSDLGYKDFIIVSSALVADGDAGLAVPTWMVDYLDDVDTMYSIICADGSRLAAIYYEGHVICAKDDTVD